MSGSEFDRIWQEASRRYAEISGKRLEELPRFRTADELIKNVDNQNKDYKHFREKSHGLLAVLSAAVKPIELVGNLAAGAASMAFPPSGMVFGAAMYLINAAKGVSASLDAIAGLLDVLKDFTVRLSMYERADLSKELREKLTQILTTVLEIFARSTKKIKDGFLTRFKTFGKNVLLGNDTEMQGLLGKLEKLTDAEDRLVGAETLVEVKQTHKGVETIQVSMTEQTMAMQGLQISQHDTLSGLGQIMGAMEEAKSVAKEEKDLKHLEALKTMLAPSGNPPERIDQIRREQVPGSGDWIRQEQALVSWIETDDKPVLWISGNPGSGKSFLMYNIIQHLTDLTQSSTSEVSEDSSVAFAFFRDNNDLTRSMQQAFRDIAYQLTQNDPAYAKYLATATHGNAEIGSIRTAWKVLFANYWLKPSENEGTAYILLDGLDEAFTEDRLTLFELLEDVLEAGSDSRLKIAMLGRPQVIYDIIDKLEEEPPSILIDATKNGGDIAHYVEASIEKKRALSKVSKKLQATIVETLTSKAGGMFMWVKLMVEELNRKAQRSRESDVEKALNEAPKGLTEMLKHVLEGYSSSLSEAEASDLNDMLMWVALAQRPLYLGELDSVLRLKSDEGQGVIDLEGQLRKSYASLFTLTRDDGLSTAELLAPKRGEDEDEDIEDAVAGAEQEDGADDLDYPTEFDSNPRTTTVSFSHASISDFFRNPKHGKVSQPECPPVGVDFELAKIVMVKTSLALIVNETLVARMKDSVSLRPYGALQWLEYVRQADRKVATPEEQLEIGKNMADVLHDPKHHPTWTGLRGWNLWREDLAGPLIPWLKHAEVIDSTTTERAEWIRALEPEKSLEVFGPAMKYMSERWLAPGTLWWSHTVVPKIIYVWRTRKEGGMYEDTDSLTVEQIVDTAEWAGLEKTAEWYRRLAMSCRDYNHYDEARAYFEKVLELDPSLWLAQGGIAVMLKAKGDYQAAIDSDEKHLKVIDADTTRDEAYKNSVGRQPAYRRMADCYWSLSQEINNDFSAETYEIDRKATKYYQLSLKLLSTDYDAVTTCFRFWDGVADLGLPYGKSEEELNNKKTSESVELPTPQECFEEIMNLLHDLNDTQRKDDPTNTNLTHYLWEYKYAEDDYFDMMARAAKGTGELEWLQGRYRDAMAAAKKKLQPVVAACLNLCLANLYFAYGDEEHKALRIWETVGTESAVNTKAETDIMYARRGALNRLGWYCIIKAAEDEHHKEKWIGKLERILARQQGRRGMAAVMQDSMPPSDIALYIAAWYRQNGRTEEARELAKPHIKDAIIILSDDDPSNDYEGYWNLSEALVAVGDEANAIAIMHALRPMKDGVAVLASDPPEEEDEDEDDTDDATTDDAKAASTEAPTSDATTSEAATDAAKSGEAADDAEDGDEADDDDDSDSDDEDDDSGWSCDGPCSRGFPYFDGAYMCRLDGTQLCDLCYALLNSEEGLPVRICSRKHDFLKVPELTTRFKEGEIVVDGVVKGIEEWKVGLKRAYGI
ncbi:hypothetical protein B0A48_12148 [Cryoendolithus antarcticus]|uniref:Uncharacterized protein n=1 Tax=Cryoendolithus antarcticus TaxID=1507870 RepID=A0A1V8SU91_9PEZI|nr:hypothetical protein B0A48_12148 [Cryoendolithus antarcticus]